MRRAHVISTLFVLALALVGCSRFNSAGTLPPGVPCANGDACSSGFCVDGVCCATGCQADEVCDAPDSRGICAPRALGRDCSAGSQCPTGHCVDGVCCDAACDGLCMTCVLDGKEGTCAPAADDTDPRHACHNDCAACYSGSCAAALPGTDPHSACGTGEVCGADWTCAGANGAVCDGDALACALGSCVGWRCLEDDYNHLDGYPFLPVDCRRTPLGASVSPGGDAAVLVLTDDGVEQGDETGNVVAVVAPSIRGPWSQVGLTYNDYQHQFGAVAMLGHVAYFVQAYDADIATTADGSAGVTIFGVTSDGRSLGNEQPDTTSILTEVTLAEDQGGLLLGELTTTGDLQLIARQASYDWSSASTVASQVDAIASATVNGRAVVFYLHAGELHAHTPDGVDVTAPRSFPDCIAGSQLAASAGQADQAEVAGLSITCAGATTLGRYDPLAAGGPSWSFFDPPTEVASNGLAGGDPWPVGLVLPCGGSNGNLIFANLFTGPQATASQFEKDLGGFSSLFWLQPDGGFADNAINNPDTQYAYLAFVAAAGPDGTVLIAYDTAELADGGLSADGGPGFATGPATLLIESLHE